MKISNIILAIIFLTYQPIFAQVNRQAYSINDKFPKYIFNAEIGDSTFQFALDAYKGKNIIIDLWDVHCSGCISGIKKMDSLQKIFSDKLKIILITKNSKEQVEKLFVRRSIPRPDLLSVVNDSVIYDTFFPHDGDPLHVWIDGSGIIRYITGGYNTTIDNIRHFINNEPLNVAYHTKLKDFNSSKPLIDEAATRLRYYTKAYSLFTLGLQDIINTNQIETLKDEKTGNTYSLKALNASKLTLYQLAFNPLLYGFELNMFRFQKNNRIILKSKRADSLGMPKKIELLDNWNKTNVYCYELFLPVENSNTFFQWMREDLKRFFNLKTNIQRNKSNCLVLTNIKKASGNKGSKKEKFRVQNNVDKWSLYNNRSEMKASVKELTYLTQNFSMPIIDETSIHTNVLIKFPPKINSIMELNQVLKKYGLCVKHEIRDVDFLVIE